MKKMIGEITSRLRTQAGIWLRRNFGPDNTEEHAKSSLELIPVRSQANNSRKSG